MVKITSYMSCSDSNAAIPLLRPPSRISRSMVLIAGIGACTLLVAFALVAMADTSPSRVELAGGTKNLQPANKHLNVRHQRLAVDLCDGFKQEPIDLLSAADFAVLAGSTVTNTGPTTVDGDLGVSPGSAVTGFPPGKMVGGLDHLHAADGASAQAIADLNTAMGVAVLLTECSDELVGNLGGMTLTPGLYISPGSMEITSGDLTLSGDGIFIFKMATTFISTTGRQIFLADGAQAKNIFWVVGSSATLGGGSVFHGTIMADQAITVGGEAAVTGRMLAKVAAVGLNANAIVLP